VVVGPIQPRAGEASQEPVEEPLVPHVHPQRDLRLFAVSAERTLADQQADQQTPVEIGQLLAHATFGPTTVVLTAARIVSP
jgi:hypothetical protein